MVHPFFICERCADVVEIEKCPALMKTQLFMSITTVHVKGWPRWMRDSVASHPQCENLGIQQVGCRESIPTICTVVNMQDCASETEFRRILTGMASNVTCLVLSDGIDVDGVVHDNEVITFRQLGDELSENSSVHPLHYYFRRWLSSNRIECHSPSLVSQQSSQASSPSESFDSSSSPHSVSEPFWLTDAEVRVETELVAVAEEGGGERTTSPKTLNLPTETATSRSIPVILSDIPENRAASPMKIPPHSTQFKLDGAVVLTLDGVVTPAMFISLAQSNSIVYLPTINGIKISITRVRSAIWIGTYTVDPNSWIPEERTYSVVSRIGRMQLAPQRTVAQLHRIKRRQFERR